jgi:hypothetical protein
VGDGVVRAATGLGVMQCVIFTPIWLAGPQPNEVVTRRTPATKTSVTAVTRMAAKALFD